MTKLKYIEKALLIGFVIAILFSFTSFTAFAAQCEQIPNEVFRLHVLANSDSEEDQALKLKVRDRLLDETGTLFSECTTKEEAMSAAKANIAYLEQVAQDEIYKQGYTYGVTVEVENIFFNNRQYDDITMPAGNYDALRVLIGEGAGQNWWCVMFPSLCFVDESKSDVNSDNLKQEIENIKPKEINNLNNENDDIKFKSKMVDVVKNLFK